MDGPQSIAAPGGAVLRRLMAMTGPPERERGVYRSWCMGSTQGRVDFSQRRLALQSRQGEFWKEYPMRLPPVHELLEPFIGWEGEQLFLQGLTFGRVETE
jgi:hypothetical protein